MKAKKKIGAGAGASAHGVVRLTESGNGKHLAVVVDVGNRSRKFSDEDLADAAWFAISTDAVPAFREFLFREEGLKLSSSRVTTDCRSYVCLRQNRWTGLRYAVVMARVANGQLRAISFHDRRPSKGQCRDRSRNAADDELVKRAITFSRSAAFREWREQVSSMETTPSSKHEQIQHGERSLKHPHAFVGFEKGERVDCRCGKNRSRGQMVACELCGAREHLDCLDYSQIPADYTCSACLRAQKEEVIVINLDEQAEGRLSNLGGGGDSWTDSKARDRGRDASVCCLCGCEDNEECETMIQPCSCDGAAVAAHPSCASLAMDCLTPKDRSRQSSPSSTCHACGRRHSISKAGSPKPAAALKRSTRRPPAETSSKSVKRLRSALVHPGKAEGDDSSTSKTKEEKVEAESKKPEVSLLGRRFSEAASTVPIKKRRIQILDSVRSPSPPSRSPSPAMKLVSPDVDEFTGSGYGNENGVESGRSYGKEVYDERLPKCTQNKVEEEEEPVHDYDISKDDDFERSEPSRGEGDSDSAILSNDDDGKATRPSDSGNRSHWDLNMYMDAWERPCEDAAASSEQPDCLGDEVVQSERVYTAEVEEKTENTSEKHDLKEEEVTEPLELSTSDAKVAEVTQEISIVPESAGIVDETGLSSSHVPVENSGGSANVVSGVAATDATAEMETSDKGEKTAEGSIAQDFTAKGSLEDETKGTSEAESEGTESKGTAEADCKGKAEAECKGTTEAECNEAECKGTTEAECNEAECKGTTEAEYKEFTECDTFEEEDEPDSAEKAKPDDETEKVEEGQITTDAWVQETGEEIEAEKLDYGDSDEGEEVADEKVSQAEVEYEGEQGEIHELDFKQEAGPESSKRDASSEDNSEAKRVHDCDEQLARSGRVKSSGWDQLPEGFETAEDALRASKELLRRGARPSAWTGGSRIRPSQFDNSFERFRHDDTSSWSRHDHHERNDLYEPDRYYSREFGRGRSRGGGPNVPPRRGELWMNGSQGQWGGPKQHHLSPPGRFADGVGFVPHGQANAAAVAAAKVESSGFIVAPDGTITKAGSPGAAVVRGGGGRPFPAAGRNPPPLMLNPSSRAAAAAADPGLQEGMSSSGRGIPGLRVGPGLGMGPGMGVSPANLRTSRGGHYVDSPTSRQTSGRGGGYLCEQYPGSRRRSRSRSRSSSPRKMSVALGRHSRSPGYGKANEAASSPALLVPKLPLPPPPPRGQRSPPAGLKRLCDRRYNSFEQQEYHQSTVEREPRTSGWDLGPGDVGRLGRFEEVDRRLDGGGHERRIGGRDSGRRDKSSVATAGAISSRHLGTTGSRGGGDGEDEVAPRRRRPPS